MRKMRNILSHISVILAIMFVVFLILDIFNPMMNFVNNDISRYLLLALCLSALGQSLLTWGMADRYAKSKARQNASR
ncbi:MAG: hypothetical protein II920_04935 [Clostridia bacterium]|nr:hypothetical protein [Clostridia bacterium]